MPRSARYGQPLVSLDSSQGEADPLRGRHFYVLVEVDYDVLGQDFLDMFLLTLGEAEVVLRDSINLPVQVIHIIVKVGLKITPGSVATPFFSLPLTHHGLSSLHR